MLTACGGGGTVEDPEVLAEQIGCADSYRAVSTNELLVESAGACTVKGHKVRLLTFASPEARDNFKDVASQFGGRYVAGDTYLVEANSPEAERAVEAALG